MGVDAGLRRRLSQCTIRNSDEYCIVRERTGQDRYIGGVLARAREKKRKASVLPHSHIHARLGTRHFCNNSAVPLSRSRRLSGSNSLSRSLNGPMRLARYNNSPVTLLVSRESKVYHTFLTFLAPNLTLEIVLVVLCELISKDSPLTRLLRTGLGRKGGE
jgi:hypothetical protein